MSKQVARQALISWHEAFSDRLKPILGRQVWSPLKPTTGYTGRVFDKRVVPGRGFFLAP